MNHFRKVFKTYGRVGQKTSHNHFEDVYSANISSTYDEGTHLYKLYGYGVCKGKPNPKIALQGSVPPFQVPEILGDIWKCIRKSPEHPKTVAFLGGSHPICFPSHPMYGITTDIRLKFIVSVGTYSIYLGKL